jgi:Bacterial archaeo-eukaryotic release factor family 10
VVSVERLDDALLELARRTDDLGVVSVYAHADPGRDPNLEGLAIDLKNRYRELQRRITDDRNREVSAALERLHPEVESLTSPIACGRGRILFAALTGNWTLRLESAMPVSNRVVLDDGPFIHPLLELLDEGQPAGVVVASPEGARLLEWRLGRLRPLGRMEQEEVEAPHERAGQIGGGPAGQFHTPMREQRQARQRDRTHRFLDRVVEAAAELAGETPMGADPGQRRRALDRTGCCGIPRPSPRCGGPRPAGPRRPR